MNRRQLLRGLTAAAALGGIQRPGWPLASAQTPLAPSPGMDGKYWFGASYYPEQWPDAEVQNDFRKMRSIGVKLVRMGEFAWSTFQSAPDVFHFEWLDRALKYASDNGIAVILSTPTASVPPWLYRLHRDVLSGNVNGAYTYGGRKGFALDSPAMREAASQLIVRLAERYGSHPAVVGWQLSNEPGYPVVNYDPNALLAFRKWLQQHYGTIEALNNAWSGPFWSNQYDDWDEIVFPLNSSEGGWNPGIKLDYRRFFSASFLEWLRFEASLVRAHTQNQFIYTNWPEVAWSVDIFQSAKFLDYVAWDNYGAMPGTAQPRQVLDTAFNHDLCRSARPDQRFFVSEQGSQPTFSTNPGAIRLTTWTDVAYGSSGTVFFEFRSPRIGSEMAYVSMVEPDGSEGVSAAVLRNTFNEIGRIYPRISKAKTVSDLALIYSYENSWDQGFRIREGNLVGAGYDNVAVRYYSGMKQLKRNIDVISSDADLNRYRMIAAPGLRIVTDDAAVRLAKWVGSGGILVLDRKAGTRMADGQLRPLVEPGVFAEIAGIKVPSLEEQHGAIQKLAFEGSAEAFDVSDCALPSGSAAETLAHYRGGVHNGQPAITLHPAGRGYVVFAGCTSRQSSFFDALFNLLSRRFSIHPLLPVSANVDVVSRSTDSTEFLFLLNNSLDPVELETPAGAKVLLGNPATGKLLTLPGLDLAILERPIAKAG